MRFGSINERIKQSESTIRAMTKANTNVKLLTTIPGIGEFFARLIDAESTTYHAVARRRSLPPMPGL
jgi:transposase